MDRIRAEGKKLVAAQPSGEELDHVVVPSMGEVLFILLMQRRCAKS